MGHTFESHRPEHQIHHIHMPQGHAHADQKYSKGMRSPIVGNLPQTNELNSAEVEPNIPTSGSDGADAPPQSY